MVGGQDLVCPWMLVREEYCIEKHGKKLVLLRRNAWSVLMCPKKLQLSHLYGSFCNTLKSLSFR